MRQAAPSDAEASGFFTSVPDADGRYGDARASRDANPPDTRLAAEVKVK